MKEPKKIIEYLSPNEKKILPYLKETKINEICKKSNLDKISVLRAMEFLQNKKILEITPKVEKIVNIGVNGAFYKKVGLPERRLLHLLDSKRIMSFEEAQKQSKLSDEEFKAALGALKNKAMIEIKNGKLFLSAKKEEVTRKTMEEIFLESLPLNYSSLSPEQMHSLKSLQGRKDIIQIKDEKTINFSLTEIGKQIMEIGIGKEDSLEQLTPEIMKKESWKGKKFRKYDVISQTPSIFGGKRHFVNQAVDYGRKVWTEMGFEEMSGNMVQSSFWNFDALFTAQDHPVREMQDTFFINSIGELPDKKIVSSVKQSHETGVGSGLERSKGWQYVWNENEAKKMVLRTHTTCLSAQTLARLKVEELPKKFFAIGKCFRNETVDWSHGFEFNQTEGIVIDQNANFRNLLGYLKQFFKKMGFEKVRFVPSYFPYTEPSVEIYAYNNEKKVWLEIGGAGIFRPEVTIPLLGKHIPVLAWGPGFDRTLMDYYQIADLRELYKNDLTKLRKMKFWMK